MSVASIGNNRANAISENEPNYEPDCERDCEVRHNITERPIARIGFRRPLEQRKWMLEKLLAHSDGIRFSEHLNGDGAIIFAHACKLGLEGIVSKRCDSPYRSGRSPHWIKSKNPDAPAVRREAEEDWGR